MSIQRYWLTVDKTSCFVQPGASGNWVAFDDHAAAIADKDSAIGRLTEQVRDKHRIADEYESQFKLLNAEIDALRKGQADQQADQHEIDLAKEIVAAVRKYLLRAE